MRQRTLNPMIAMPRGQTLVRLKMFNKITDLSIPFFNLFIIFSLWAYEDKSKVK